MFLSHRNKLSLGLTRATCGNFLNYVRDGLKLYMPYKGHPAEETKFVGTGSTSFDGVNDYVDFGDIALTDFTVTAWVKMDDAPAGWSSGSNGNVIVGDAANTDWIRINDATVFSVKAGTHGGINLTHGLTFTGGAWEHVVVKRAGDTITVYRNGIAGGTTGTLAGTNTFTPEYIGQKGSSTDYFDGSMKNVAVWNRALTATEVQNVMYKRYEDIDQTGRLASGLVSWWALDDADVYVKSLASSTLGSLTREITSELTTGETYTVKFNVELDTASSVLCSIGTGAYGTQIYSTGYITSYPNTSDAFTFSSGEVHLTVIITPNTSIAYIKSIQVLDSNNNIVWEDFTTPSEWTAANTVASNRYIDNKGTNHGTSGDGSTASTFPTHTYERYGQQSPVIPRAIDNAPTVQADSIGAGSASFNGTSDVINTGQFEDLFLGGATMMAWIKPSSDGENSEGRIFDKSNNVGADDGPVLMVADESSGACDLRFMHGHWSAIGDWSTTSRDVTIGEWNHVAVTYNSSSDSNNPVLYVNGVSSPISETASGSGDAVDSNHTLYIGNNTGTERTFDGNICQVGMWQGALTQEKIQSVMEKTFEELTDTEKSSVGSELELWDSPASVFTSGTYAWVVYGSNTIANDSNTLKITYVDDSRGAYVWFKDASDLSSDLTVGKTYRVTFDAKVGSGDSVNVTAHGTGTPMVTVTETTFTSKSIDFVCSNATANYLDTLAMASGEEIWLDNISLKEVAYDLVSYWALDDGENENTTKHYTVADSMSTFGDNLLADGDAGSDNWTNDTGGTNPALVNEKSSEYAKEGTYSRKFVIDGSSDAIHTPTFTTESSAVYQVSFWIRPSATSINFYVKQGDGSGTNTTASENGSSTTWFRSFTANEWNKITTYYTESSGGSSAYLEFESPGTSDGTHYIDEVKVRKVLTGNFGELF